jgi:S-adenosyl methyltransferase
VGSEQQGSSSASPGWVPPRVDPSVPHPARRYDYWLGGKDNFAADRESGDAIAASFPTIRTSVLENRGFLHRAVAYLAEEAGIRQFLDIGTGIPTSPNVHEIAQAIAPAARVVYVDNDPVVLAHARALLTSSAAGATAYVDADLRQPEKILDAPELRSVLDFSQPIAIILVATIHFIEDADDPYGIVARLVGAVPAGSYLVMSHATSDYLPAELVAEVAAGRHGRGQLRSRAEFERFFEGLDLVEPGIVSVSDWRADAAPRPRPAPADVAVFGAVAKIG